MSIFREKRLAAAAVSLESTAWYKLLRMISRCVLIESLAQLHSCRKSPDEERGILEDRQIDVPEVAWINRKVPES